MLHAWAPKKKSRVKNASIKGDKLESLTTSANDQTVSDGVTREGTRSSSSLTEIEDAGEDQDDGGHAGNWVIE